MAKPLLLAIAPAVLLVAAQAFAGPPPPRAGGAAIQPNMWGRTSQLGATVRAVRAVEAQTPPATSFAARQPLLNRFGAYLQGLPRASAQREVGAFIAQHEAQWGPTTTLRPSDPGVGARRYGVFVAEKTLALDTYRRTPAEVTDHVITASGSVGDRTIPSRQIFAQHWMPVQEGTRDADGKLVPSAAPTGKVFVISPGYTETGRNFYKQIDALTRQGHDVIVMDHQWAGYSDGKPGAIDSGFGVARDVAAVAAYADKIARAQYPNNPNREVILVGNSMGGGRGVVGAMAMNDAGKIKLDGGAQMPKNVSAIVEAPFFRATPSVTNKVFTAASHVPGVRDVPAFASGTPKLTSDHVAQARGADHLTMDDVRTRASAFSTTDADMRTMMAHTGSIGGRVYVIQSEHDTLADPQATRDFVAQLGPRARLETVAGSDHVLEESPRDEGRILHGVRWLGASPH